MLLVTVEGICIVVVVPDDCGLRGGGLAGDIESFVELLKGPSKIWEVKGSGFDYRNIVTSSRASFF